ncbi:MAG TPA: ATP-binding cassette domain-containing protein, partial [Trueperaceae bacterium]|nr:ATP-binding cassette domain-containing protein [Trueperaceae bacterium]
MSGYLECHKLSKAYDGTRALQDVSLRVGRGRVHAVIGENGAGKSTLVNAIAGLVPFDSGTLTLAGRPYRPASPRQAAAAGVGMV